MLQPLYYLRNKACLEKYATAQQGSPKFKTPASLNFPYCHDCLYPEPESIELSGTIKKDQFSLTLNVTSKYPRRYQQTRMTADTWGIFRSSGKTISSLLPTTNSLEIRQQTESSTDNDLVELCIKCRRVLDWLPRVTHYTYTGGQGDRQDFRHWDSVSMVEDSAAHGCRFCLLFMHGIR